MTRQEGEQVDCVAILNSPKWPLLVRVPFGLGAQVSSTTVQ